MRGAFIFSKVRTRADYDILGEEDKLFFKGLLRGTINKQRDIREYPDGYFEEEVQEGDEGYLAPILEDYEDLSVINRFGFTKEDLEIE